MSDEVVRATVGEARDARPFPDRIAYSYESVLRLVEQEYPDDTVEIGSPVSFSDCPLANILRRLDARVSGVTHKMVGFAEVPGGYTSYTAELGEELQELVVAIDQHAVEISPDRSQHMPLSVGQLKGMLRRRIGG